MTCVTGGRRGHEPRQRAILLFGEDAASAQADGVHEEGNGHAGGEVGERVVVVVGGRSCCFLLNFD